MFLSARKSSHFTPPLKTSCPFICFPHSPLSDTYNTCEGRLFTGSHFQATLGTLPLCLLIQLKFVIPLSSPDPLLCARVHLHLEFTKTPRISHLIEGENSTRSNGATSQRSHPPRQGHHGHTTLCIEFHSLDPEMPLLTSLWSYVLLAMPWAVSSLRAETNGVLLVSILRL